MKLSLGANISRLRKAHSMTQEQLAEALGVTFAAVSKWERGVATPELNLIAEMADLFEVSMDAMVGFSFLGKGKSELVDRICTLRKQKQFEAAGVEAEKALLRYPNEFQVVFESGRLYVLGGIEEKREKYLRRGIELLERSILLLPQNTNKDISEISIGQEIAQCYICLGETKQGLDILKKYNVSGVYNSLIAIALTGNDITYTGFPAYGLEEAVPYMTGALGDILSNTLRTMMAFANYYYKKGAYGASRESLLWLIEFMESLKIDREVVAYVDKVIAPSYSECAHLSLLLGEGDRAEPYLRRAYKVAKRYDTNPTNRLDNLKFFPVGELDNAAAYDDLGKTAMEAIATQLAKENRAAGLRELWKRIVEEEEEKNRG